MTPWNDSVKENEEAYRPFSIEIEKNDVTQIWVSRREFKGRAYIDVRTYVKTDAGEFIPTKKGVTFSPDMLSTIIHALKQIHQEGSE
jgi:hypothetical protein